MNEENTSQKIETVGQDNTVAGTAKNFFNAIKWPLIAFGAGYLTAIIVAKKKVAV